MTFDGIQGHASHIERLKERIRKGNVPHALLFTGPRGVGKRKVALSLAQAIVCARFPQSPCGTCPACEKMSRGSLLDVIQIVPEGKSQTIKIEAIRTVRKTVMLKPFEARAQVVIIEEANAMNPDAQNALLKILEEPPPKVHFVLLTQRWGCTGGS